MKKTSINIDISSFPEELREYISGARVYDSSSSPAAKVLYIERGSGYYVKRAKKGELYAEARLGDYFHSISLAPKVIKYISADFDYLLTERARGEDLTGKEFLKEPERLSSMLGIILRQLHDTPYTGCPITDRCADYISGAEKNFKRGMFDSSMLSPQLKLRSANEVFTYAIQRRNILKSNLLIHGDFCLPNIIVGNSGVSFIDLGGAGVGDRHIDLFWGAWSLTYNLGTDKYRNIFFDSYGRDRVDEEALLVVSAFECFG